MNPAVDAYSTSCAHEVADSIRRNHLEFATEGHCLRRSVVAIRCFISASCAHGSNDDHSAHAAHEQRDAGNGVDHGCHQRERTGCLTPTPSRRWSHQGAICPSWRGSADSRPSSGLRHLRATEEAEDWEQAADEPASPLRKQRIADNTRFDSLCLDAELPQSWKDSVQRQAIRRDGY